MRYFKCTFCVLTIMFGLIFTSFEEVQATEETIVLKDGYVVNNRTIVPMRTIFEELGATVHWNSSTSTVTAQKDNTHITLKIGTKDSFINGEKIIIDVPAQIHNGRTYVPVRFVSESLGATVHWNSSLQIVTINTLTKKLVIKVGESQKDFSIKGISIGDLESEVIAIAGHPIHSYKSEYGFEWYIFHNNYNNYFQVGIQNERVVALYTNHDLIQSKDKLSLNSSRTAIRNRYGTPLSSISKGSTRYIYDTDGGHDLYLIDDYYATFFYDIHQSNQVTSLQLIDKQVEHNKKGFYGTASNELRNSFELQLFDLTNAVRVKFGITPLEKNQEVAVTARNHSKDMAINNYFSHTNLDGLSPFQRMEADGISYDTAGENIAMGQYSSIFAHEGLMNSKGHRQNILNKRFTGLGTGVSFRNNIPYYTQNFITP